MTDGTGRTFRDAQLLESTFEHVDLTGSRFERVDLTRSTFQMVDLSDVEVRDTALYRVRMRGVELMDVDISGELRRVRVNGIDIGPLVEAELDRRHPERTRLRPTTPEGYRQAWRVLAELWEGTVERARALERRDPDLLHESVAGEWSFTETLRHLAFATSCWLNRAIQGEPAPWGPLELPWDTMPDTQGVPRDHEVRPSLDEALEVRGERQAQVTAYLDQLTQEVLDSQTTPVEGPGWPPSQSFPLKECLDTLVNEEWWHRQYAERDLAVIEERLAGEPHSDTVDDRRPKEDDT